jgi:hypothetical protein
MSVTQLVSVFAALGIQHAMHMRHIVICGLPRFTLFFHILINGTIFEKKKLLNIKCVFRVSLQLETEKSFILRRNEQDMIKKCVSLFM